MLEGVGSIGSSTILVNSSSFILSFAALLAFDRRSIVLFRCPRACSLEPTTVSRRYVYHYHSRRRRDRTHDNGPKARALHACTLSRRIGTHRGIGRDALFQCEDVNRSSLIAFHCWLIRKHAFSVDISNLNVRQADRPTGQPCAFFSSSSCSSSWLQRPPPRPTFAAIHKSCGPMRRPAGTLHRKWPTHVRLGCWLVVADRQLDPSHVHTYIRCRPCPRRRRRHPAPLRHNAPEPNRWVSTAHAHTTDTDALYILLASPHLT